MKYSFVTIFARELMRKVLLCLAGLLLLLILSAWAYRQFVLLPHARAVVGDHSVDPSSVQWRNERFIGPWSTSGFYVYCAEGNLPNRAGGYDGFHDVMVMADRIMIAGNENPGLVDELCGNRKEAAEWWWLRW